MIQIQNINNIYKKNKEKESKLIFLLVYIIMISKNFKLNMNRNKIK